MYHIFVIFLCYTAGWMATYCARDGQQARPYAQLICMLLSKLTCKWPLFVSNLMRDVPICKVTYYVSYVSCHLFTLLSKFCVFAESRCYFCETFCGMYEVFSLETS